MNAKPILMGLVFALTFGALCREIPSKRETALYRPSGVPTPRRMVCSYYADSLAGRRTASGERYAPSDYTAASNRFPIGTRLRVTHGGRSVSVRVNDRLSSRYSDRLDLSRAAFSDLAELSRGLVEAEIIEIP